MITEESMLAALDKPRRIEMLQHLLDPANKSADALEKLLMGLRDAGKVSFDTHFERWKRTVTIQSHDLWVKVVEMLQQNWALVEPGTDNSVRVYFISDASGVFDEMAFPSVGAAHKALHLNEFKSFANDSDLKSFLKPPSAPFHKAPHPNGPIYSSGRFWKG